MSLKYKDSYGSKFDLSTLTGTPVILQCGDTCMAEDLEEGDKFRTRANGSLYTVVEDVDLFEHEMVIRFKTPSKLRDANSWKSAIEDRLLNGNPSRSRPGVKRVVTSVSLRRV